MKKKRVQKAVKVGFDIGTRVIKAVELSLEGNKQRLLRFNFIDIDYPPSIDKLAQAIRSLLENFHPTSKDVNVSLSAPAAIVRFITMPKMKREDLKNSLRFEAEKYIPFNINEVVIDAYILEQEEAGSQQMKVLLAAAKKDAVSARIELMRSLGFAVSIIDIDCFACFNAFCNTFDNIDPAKSIALLNAGYSQTNVIIARGDRPFFTRDIQIGGKDFVKAIANELQIEEKEADDILFKKKDKGPQVAEITKSVLTTFFDELRLSFGYYENQYGKSINGIYVSGGISRMEDLTKGIEENFGIKPDYWNPFSKFELAPDIDGKSLETVQPQFAVCAGLAIRG